MTYEILVKSNGNGFVAAAVGMPDCIVQAATRDEAVENAKLKVLDWLGRSEVVKVELDDAPTAARRGGELLAHISEETRNGFLEATRQARAEMDADPIEVNGQAENKGPERRKSFAGMWANDKTFDDFQAAMKAYRAELNNDPNQL
ncbi:MAG: hypothetical protein ABI977_05395 [Acidobacteriota bacterium]